MNALLKVTPPRTGGSDVIAERRARSSSSGVPPVPPHSLAWRRRRRLCPASTAMDNPGESPTDKGGEPEESEEMRATPGAPAAADTEGIPEETDGDGDADLKEAAAEESEVGSSLW